MLRPQDRPCDHNTIPLSRRRFFVGPYVKFWRCIKCDLDFDEQWLSGAELLAEARADRTYEIQEEP